MSVYAIEGNTGDGKTTRMAKHAYTILRRDLRLLRDKGQVRTLTSNLFFSERIERQFGLHSSMLGRQFEIVDDFGEKYVHEIDPQLVSDQGLIRYWLDPRDLVQFHDGDVLWDEMGVDLDATQWESMPREFRRWFQQHRKRGIESIVGTCQDFGQVDKSVRRLAAVVYRCRKIFSSADPTAQCPVVRPIWGIVMVSSCDARLWRDDTTGAYVPWGFPPSFYWLDEDLCTMFDTRQPVGQQRKPRLRHMEASCPHCGEHKCTHQWLS